VEDPLTDTVGALAFSPNGRVLACSSARQSSIHVLEVATGKERLRLDGHKGAVVSLVFSMDGRTLVSSSEDTTALVWDLAGTRSGQRPPLEPGTALRDLAGSDASVAFAVMRRLAAQPEYALALLRQHLKAVAKPDAPLMAKLVADLGSEQVDVRAAAQRGLEQMEDAALPACRAALAGARSVEYRRRLEDLIDRQVRARWHPDADRLRRLRAVEVLEMAGTADCRALLEQLARGAGGSQLTEEAQASLRRLVHR
jgi:hypothetical protein